ncbi:hypothetical protein FRUB_03687 [Fimbriiglobus ruber]|uniref:Uncharacterized protein n=1 Tax=Fimbriiglobus ruber TaxID=1908690 RepID=A0A225DWP7_9BACT|nr:hypothetical protein FRUB_03687 [Fimbriiglobus ruber]
MYAVLTFWVAEAETADLPVPVRTAVASHRAAREAIETCSCHVEFDLKITEPKREASQPCSCDYWFTPQATRAKMRDSGEATDAVWRDSVRDSVTHRSPTNQSSIGASKDKRPSRYIGRCDAWVRGLLVLNVPGTIQNVPLEQLVELAAKVTGGQSVKAGGRQLTLLTLSFPAKPPDATAWEIDVFLDPAVNYLVRQINYRARDVPNFDRVEQVTSFKECSPGVYFPERVEGSSGPIDTPGTVSTTVISNIAVNKPIPAGVMTFRFPEGIILSDGIRGTSYRITSDGRAIGPEIPLGKAPPPVREGASTTQPVSTSETTEEPKSATRWIAPAGVGLVLIGLLISVVRRRRRGRSGE